MVKWSVTCVITAIYDTINARTYPQQVVKRLEEGYRVRYFDRSFYHQVVACELMFTNIFVYIQVCYVYKFVMYTSLLCIQVCYVYKFVMYTSLLLWPELWPSSQSYWPANKCIYIHAYIYIYIYIYVYIYIYIHI